jgi:hypothetical protein
MYEQGVDYFTIYAGSGWLHVLPDHPMGHRHRGGSIPPNGASGTPWRISYTRFEEIFAKSCGRMTSFSLRDGGSPAASLTPTTCSSPPELETLSP